MKDEGHRACVDAALNHENTDRIPVNNFALVTAARSAGYKVNEGRWNPVVSAKTSIDYAIKTKSDFVKPILDSQVPFTDLGMEVTYPEDDYGHIAKNIVDTEEDIDGLAIFDPYKASECPNFTKVFVESLNETARTLPEDLHICGLSWGPITTAGYLMGTENMILNTMMEPELVKKLIKKITPLVTEIEKCMIDAGATVMWMADPTSSEDLISSDMFAEYSKNPIKEVVSGVKSMDSSIPAFVHICGNTLNSMKHLKDTGTDCLSFDHAVDPGEAKRRAGRDIAIMGNIDPVKEIMMGTPESITKECNRIMDAAAGDGGFILAPGCETPLASPDENVLAMGLAARQWKR